MGAGGGELNALAGEKDLAAEMMDAWDDVQFERGSWSMRFPVPRVRSKALGFPASYETLCSLE